MVIIVLAILVKVGKLPKLKAALERMVQKDRERRQAIKDQDAIDKEEKRERKIEKKDARAEKREEKREARAEKHGGRVQNDESTSIDNCFVENTTNSDDASDR